MHTVFVPRRVITLLLLFALLLAFAACEPDRTEPFSTSAPSAAGSALPPEDAPSDVSSSEPPVSALPPASEPEQSQQVDPLPGESLPGEAPVQEVFGRNFCYVALGDSICRGYGLSDPATQRYSSIIGRETGCTVYNYGVDGQTGEELLTFLREGKAEALPEADVVSVCIGANNLLHALSDLIRSLLSSNASISQAESTVDAGALLDAANEALTSFREELPAILEQISEANPDATVLLQTVYNPYRGFTQISLRVNGEKTTFADVADLCVTQLNDILRDGAKTYGCTLCDVYDAFEQTSGQLVNASLGRLNFDPHPTADGHLIIAEVLRKNLPVSD